MRRARAIARAKTRCDDLRVRMICQRVCPQTFVVMFIGGIPNSKRFGKRAQRINVPLQFFGRAPMPRHARAQSARAARAADVHIIAARKIERAAFADWDARRARHVQQQGIRAARGRECGRIARGKWHQRNLVTDRRKNQFARDCRWADSTACGSSWDFAYAGRRTIGCSRRVRALPNSTPM